MTDAMTGDHAQTDAMTGDHAQTDAMTEVHALTDVMTEVHAVTDATTEVHAVTDATTEVHALTDATTEAHALTDAMTEAHAQTDATIGAHAQTDATIEAHVLTIVTVVILDHSVMTVLHASAIVMVKSASPLPMSRHHCANLGEGPQRAEVVLVEVRVDAGQVLEVKADVVWADVARMGFRLRLHQRAAEIRMNVARKHTYLIATCLKKTWTRTNPKRERCEAGGRNHPLMEKPRNRILCQNQYC